jgi:hypothetical protein
MSFENKKIILFCSFFLADMSPKQQSGDVGNPAPAGEGGEGAAGGHSGAGDSP